MEKTLIKNKFIALTEEEKLFFLIDLAYNLSIIARGYYYKENDPTIFYALNETMHIIIGHILNIVKNSSERYPDDVFIDIVFEASNYNKLSCETDLYASIEKILSEIEKNK